MRAIFSFFFLFSTLFGTVVEDQSGLTVLTPSLKERKVRKVRLDNQLEAILISDPGTQQSGAALAVGVGSWDNPKERLGMAHFVEHLLFLGTEKYPEEHEYMRYLDEHGGTRNAFTMSDRTVYMFSVNNEGFCGALDRFSQFFIAPLFNPSGVARECHAIHQEFCRNIPSDRWRCFHVRKELANKEHPFHCFCTGNLDTLAKISQDELKAWYQKHYSANLMHLVVLSPADLDTLESQVIEYFSHVENRQNICQKCNTTMLSDETSGKLITIDPIQDVQLLELAWEVPEQNRDVKAGSLIAHILGHEGETSLLSQLKKEGLADALSAGCSQEGKGQSLFNLSVHLTQKGLKEHETVIARCFEAIARFRLTGIPRYVYNEVREIYTLSYNYQSRKDVFEMVTDYAVNMIDEPLETFPLKTVMPTHYSPEIIDETLSCLTPEKCQYTLLAPKNLCKIEPDCQEKWMDVSYSVKPLPKKQLKNWSISTPHPEIALPDPNSYLPTSFALCKQEATELPKLIDETPYGKCYLQTDEQFGVPEVSWTFTFKTPHISDNNPKSQVLADLYCHTITQELNSKAYLAKMAGLEYQLKPCSNGVELTLQGFHDKAPLFLSEILQTMKQTTPTKETFATYKDLAHRCYCNESSSSAIMTAKEMMWDAVYKEYAGACQKEDVLSNVSFDHLKKFTAKVWDKSYVEVMLYGNVTESQAEEIWLETESHFSKAPYAPSLHYQAEVASFSNIHLISKKFELPSNALILCLDLGPFSFKRRAAMDILCKGLEEPFFTELRTKQQTAYLVRNWGQEIERHLYAFLAVQSSSYETRDLLSRFELFLESSLREIEGETIPRERFDSIKVALIEKLKHPAENLLTQGKLLNRLAFEYNGDFKWLDKRIAGIKELSYEEFIALSHDFLGKNNRKRLAVCVDGAIPQEGTLQYESISTLDKLKKRIQYQRKAQQ
ncbi:MAG: Protease 3 [Chlamydiales bacterium]|nr:Protease 3 [Chlamydiales bacterium]MCH9620532.1 Protease 3 [Chlamydiales bacterium]MCH9623020.1 Protease 3 [Chlamydiales bacterium]